MALPLPKDGKTTSGPTADAWNGRYDWEEYICKLRAYTEKHGTANVPRDRNHNNQGPTLSRWVENLRRRKQQSELEELGFDFGNPSSAKFDS